MKKQKFLLIIVSTFILFIGYISIIEIPQLLPVPHYQKPKTIDPFSLCKKIQNQEYQKLCFSKIKNNDLKIENLISIKPTFSWGIKESLYNWPNELKEALSNAKNNPAWCDNYPSKKWKYLCLAYVKNPHYCKKMIKKYNERAGCYWDAAIIWKNPSLCEKAVNSFYYHEDKLQKEKYKDFCYLVIVFKVLENKK